MPEPFLLNKNEVNKLLGQPLTAVLGRFGAVHFTAEVLSPNLQEQIITHYGAKQANCPDVKFKQFGLKVAFSKAVEIKLYDENFTLLPQLKELISIFGLVTFENAYFSEKQRKEGQKNIFPSLAFHVDRGASFDNQYSLFVRDPFDVEQIKPRGSGTLIISNQVARLQASKEGINEMDMCSRYDLFTKERVEEYFGRFMVNQSWQAPEGVGEVCIFDNRTVLHASFYRGKKGGYKIGVRYLY